jgi:hypothetical protein
MKGLFLLGRGADEQVIKDVIVSLILRLEADPRLLEQILLHEGPVKRNEKIIKRPKQTNKPKAKKSFSHFRFMINHP